MTRRMTALAPVTMAVLVTSCGGAARDPAIVDVTVPPGTPAGAERPIVQVPAAVAAAHLDPAAIERGAALFRRSCAACHGELGAGLVGPNLTDDASLHGNQLESVQRVIAVGVPAKGMPGWEPMLGKSSVHDLAIFVLSIAPPASSNR